MIAEFLQRLFLGAPPSPASTNERVSFEQVSKDPMIYPASSTGKAGLKFFGKGEEKKYQGCQYKLKLMGKDNNSFRYGVQKRAPKKEEKNAISKCGTVLEVNFNKIVKK